MYAISSTIRPRIPRTQETRPNGRASPPQHYVNWRHPSLRQRANSRTTAACLKSLQLPNWSERKTTRTRQEYCGRIVGLGYIKSTAKPPSFRPSPPHQKTTNPGILPPSSRAAASKANRSLNRPLLNICAENQTQPIDPPTVTPNSAHFPNVRKPANLFAGRALRSHNPYPASATSSRPPRARLLRLSSTFMKLI